MATQPGGGFGGYAGGIGKRYGAGQLKGLMGGGGESNLFGNMFGSSAGGGSFMGMGGGGSSGTPWGLLAGLTAIAQGAGDRQSEGGVASRLQEGFLPSPYKAWRHSPKEGAIASFAPFMNLWREPNIKGTEDSERFLGVFGGGGF